MQSLQDDISLALVPSPWERKSFLPASEIESLITPARIDPVSEVSDIPAAAYDDSRKVIGILININKLGSFTELRHQGLKDDLLPVEHDKGKKALVSIRGGRLVKPTSFRPADFGRFLTDQWLFLSPIFGEAYMRDLDVRCPLPIIHIGKEHEEGSFGEVDKVQIHHAHLLVGANTQSTRGKEPFIAIKRLKSDSLSEFKREEDALYRILALRHEHLIEVIASFKRGEEYFFLFPWADGGDLRQAWKDKSAELRTTDMVQWAFEQMKGIASGLRSLHSPSENRSEENGRHGDLRPENILLFLDDAQNPRGTLRISDVGLARFHNEITIKRAAGTVTAGGSREYAPPEAFVEGRKGSRKYDIWSLGCIFLEFAVWILGGNNAVELFQQSRKSKKSEHYEFFYMKTKLLGNPSPKILPKVQSYIKLIRDDARCRPTCALADLVGLIENHLLRVIENDRLDALEVDKRLGGILDKARREDDYVLGCFDAKKGFKPQGFP